MADTIRSAQENINCSDCGRLGTEFRHWGPLVPEGASGNFCGFCWHERNKDSNQGDLPRPLGDSRLTVGMVAMSLEAPWANAEDGIKTLVGEEMWNTNISHENIEWLTKFFEAAIEKNYGFDRSFLKQCLYAMTHYFKKE